MNRVRTEVFTKAQVPDLVRFFENAGSSCFCRYWHFGGDKNAWLERAAFAPEASASELRDAATSADGTADGICAWSEGESSASIVGWLKLVRLARMEKLLKLGAYRRLDLDGTHLAVGCVLVLPEWREQGVSHALVRAAIAEAHSRGEPALFAFPRAEGRRLHDEEALMGPEGAFDAAGFRAHAGERPYPVLRRALP